MSDPGTIMREARNARGLRQSELAERLNVTQSLVSLLERGRVDLPSDDVRAKLLEHLGVDPYAERAAERVGKVSASEFSRRTRVDIHSVLRLIAEDLLPAQFLGDGLGYELNEREALAALDALERCRYEGCDEPATTETGCCGLHAQRQWAIDVRGTQRSADERERIREGRVRLANTTWHRRIAASKRGQPRPDVPERVAEMHKDPLTHHDWRRKAMRGRLESENPRCAKPTPETMTKVERAYNGVVGARAAGRVGGRQRGYTDEHVARARQLKRLDPNLGRVRLKTLLAATRPALSPVTEDQARAILAEIEG